MTNHYLRDIKKRWQDKEMAESYDDVRFGTLSGKLSGTLDKLAIKKALAEISINGKILDIPCGTGRITQYLYRFGYKNITGADISEKMINAAKNKIPSSDHISFVITEAEHTDFPDNSFDAITSIRFMGHVPRDTRVEILIELNRICKGLIIIDYSIRKVYTRKSKNLLRRLTLQGKLPIQREWHDVSYNELEEELREAGLRAVKLIDKLPFFSELVFVVAERTDK